MRRTLLVPLGWTAALAGAAALAWWLARPGPLAVEVAQVDRGPLQATVEAEGVTRVRTPWTVAAPVPGTLARPRILPGDQVMAGQTVVATLYPADPPLLDARSRAEAGAAEAEALAAVGLAEVRLTQATEAREWAESRLARTRALAERGTAAQAQLDADQRALDIATREVQAARSALDLARAGLERARALVRPADPAVPGGCCLTLVAPIDGVVLTLHETEARLVPAGTSLVTLGDPADLVVETEVLSADAVRLRPGAQAWILDWGGAEALDAVVSRVEPAGRTRVSALGLEEQRVTVHLDLVTPPERRGGLGDRFRVLVRMVLWEAADLPRVPVAALFRMGEGWAVMAVHEGRAVQRAVHIGRMDDRHAEVLAGLEPGEAVILYPPSDLRPGTAVAAGNTGGEN